MIYKATFNGRSVNASGIFQSIVTHCYGDTSEAAEINLYDRYEHISNLKLVESPITTVGECKPNDRIYRVENGQLTGHIDPHNSFYVVSEKSDIVCSGEYANHVTCRNGAGILVPIHPSLTCIVSND